MLGKELRPTKLLEDLGVNEASLVPYSTHGMNTPIKLMGAKDVVDTIRSESYLVDSLITMNT